MQLTDHQTRTIQSFEAKSLFGDAVKFLTGAGSDVAWGCDKQNLNLINLQRAIQRANKGLEALLEIENMLYADITVNLSEQANGMAQSTETDLRADESPVIRRLPETDKIQPLLRMPTSSHAVPLEI